MATTTNAGTRSSVAAECGRSPGRRAACVIGCRTSAAAAVAQNAAAIGQISSPGAMIAASMPAARLPAMNATEPQSRTGP